MLAATLLALTSCISGEAPEFHSCDFVAFVVFDGVRYSKSSTNHGLGNVKTGGEYDRVERDLTRDVPDCRTYTPASGDAAFVSAGTAFYNVQGYRPKFLLATNVAGDGDVWEADFAPEAQRGQELLDLESGLRRIALLDYPEAAMALGTIEDPAQLQQFVDFVSNAEVDQSADQSGEVPRYYISFEMQDGLNFRRIYRADTGELSGIMLPEEAQRMLRDALEGL